MTPRVRLSAADVRVSKPGRDVTTCGIGDLSLWIGARQGQVLQTGFKASDSATFLGGFTYRFVATVSFSTLPRLADAFVQPIIRSSPSGFDPTAEICGIGFVSFAPPPNPLFYQYVRPGPMTVDLSTTSLVITLDCDYEVIGFRYLILRKPTES